MKPTVLMLALCAATLQTPQARCAPEASVQKSEVSTVAIKLKHVPPSLMAFWLAPGELPEPEVSFSRQELEKVAAKGTPQAEIDAILNKGKRSRNLPPRTKGGVFDLPAGVHSVTPDEETGEIQVRGTAEGIARLRQIVEFLDLPMRKVELEVMSVRLSKADLNTFGLEAATPAAEISLGTPRSNYRKLLQPLLDANRASTLLDVRGVVTNNLTGFFSSDPSSSGSFAQSPSPLPTAQVQLVPTINNDDTITVVLQAITKIPRSTTPQPGSQAQVVANVRDGDTIFLLAPDDNKESKQATIVFLTTRIVRSAGDKK